MINILTNKVDSRHIRHLLPLLSHAEMQSDVAFTKLTDLHDGSHNILCSLIINEYFECKYLLIDVISIAHSHLLIFFIIVRWHECQQVRQYSFLHLNQVNVRSVILIVLEEFEVSTRGTAVVVFMLHY
jgi:hypothetical protein